MWYVYVLESLRNKRKYIGLIGNLKRRVNEHNQGIGGGYSQRNKPFRLIFYEAYCNRKDAAKAEEFFKTGYGREVLKGKLESYLSYI